MRETGDLPRDQSRIRLRLQVGVLDLRVEEGGRIFMRQPPPQFGEVWDSRQDLAECLGLDQRDIDPHLPCQVVSTGFPVLFVPLTCLECAGKVSLQSARLKEIFDRTGVDMIYVFTQETLDPLSTLHVRAFAPFIGIPEDPATGSAGGAMGAYWARYSGAGGKVPVRIQIEQGSEMGRPSTLFVNVEREGDRPSLVEVGGDSRLVIRGHLYLTD
ncbi:MAG: hypothetical protein COV67_02355 [Nitrospinae bacterium CG11_big_fil_rev_8_21_14_0_20_56_8]|nr:MAG: hypothetical protein COV67_02355 [Nitrospinae bacterium CG11_big_fil_rev_8_21_14_0_20_56_8]